MNITDTLLDDTDALFVIHPSPDFFADMHNQEVLLEARRKQIRQFYILEPGEVLEGIFRPNTVEEVNLTMVQYCSVADPYRLAILKKDILTLIAGIPTKANRAYSPSQWTWKDTAACIGLVLAIAIFALT